MIEITEEEYKAAKEAHVSGCTGGSVMEINLVCLSLVSSFLLWSALIKTKIISNETFIPQFALFALPVLSATTIASDYAVHISLAMMSIALLILWTHRQQTSSDEKEEKEDGYKPYLVVYRAGTMILTCIAILAVDFQFFPRRFAKVETFGTSLMDVGVGSFVFSSGIVSSRAYLKENNSNKTMLKEMLNAIRSTLPLLALGFLRLFLTKSVNYQEHTSEYGLHWNFFFTLGFLPPFVTLLGFLHRFVSFFKLASMIAIAYQITLCYGLQEWILEHPRVDLMTANKEGICSFVGYLSIFLFGLHCGTLIFKQTKPHNRLSSQLLVFGLLMWTIFGVWVSAFPTYYVSRRMANLPYIHWVIAFNVTLLSLIVFVQEQLKINGRGPSMLDALNINGLFTFLLANVLTGLTNLSIRTLYVSDFASSLINIIYMFIVCFIPWIMWRRFQIRVKF